MHENDLFHCLVHSLFHFGLQVTDFKITLLQEMDEVR